MRPIMLALGFLSAMALATSALADHRHDLLEHSEELAEACEHLAEQLLVSSGYERSAYAVEEMAEAAEHFYEIVLLTSDLDHIYDDYREFYAAYKETRTALRADYTGSSEDHHIMEDWMEISHTFRSVRRIMRYYRP